MKKMILLSGALMSLLTACNLSNAPTTPAVGTPAVMVITATPSDTPVPAAATTAPAPSATPAPSETATDAASPTLAASATNTQPPSITPTASITPLPTIGFRYDPWERVEVPPALQGGAAKAYVIFTNTNDQETITSLATARPENERLLVYAVDPDFPDTRITLLELNAATGTRIYPSASGKGLAYFRDGSTSPGLYIMDLAGDPYVITARVAALNSLVQRGIYSPPNWSPDGEQLAVALANGYDLDIFLYARDGSKRDPLPDLNTGAYEFYPAFSPDGRSIAFVSDRATCPTWTPGEAEACDALTTPQPIGGQLYVMDLDSKEVRQISEEYVTEPPTWINNTLLAFAVGDGQNLLKPERQLWLANIPGQTARQIALANDTGGLYLSDVWSPDGTKVLFQYVTPSTTSLVMMNSNGTVINERTDDLAFPRYGMRAAWSPQDNRIALGGTSSECPYGMRVVDEIFEYISRGNASPTMCNPIFSPNGRFIAFTGVNASPDRRNPDGRQDVYISDSNGYGQRNLSANLRGSTALIGWLGGQ